MMGLMNAISLCGVPSRTLPTLIAFALLHVPLGVSAKTGADIVSLILFSLLAALYLALSLHAILATMGRFPRIVLLLFLGLYLCAHLILIRKFLTSAD